MSHFDNEADNEAEDRAIARALDAEIDAEQTDEDAMDRATLDDYRQVLASMPFEEIEPRAELEDHVLEAALARRPAAVRSISSAKRRRTLRWATLGAAVAAAAAVIAFMFVTSDTDSVQGGEIALAGDNAADVVTPVRETPGVRTAPLTADDRNVGEAALAPDGNGVLYDLDLPALGQGQRFYVWLVTESKVVPIGYLEAPTDTISFEVQGDADAVTGVSISLESGSDTPTTPAPGGAVASAKF